MSARINAGIRLVLIATQEAGQVRAVMRNGRFLVRFAGRSEWYSPHEKTYFREEDRESGEQVV